MGSVFHQYLIADSDSAHFLIGKVNEKFPLNPIKQSSFVSVFSILNTSSIVSSKTVFDICFCFSGRFTQEEPSILKEGDDLFDEYRNCIIRRIIHSNYSRRTIFVCYLRTTEIFYSFTIWRVDLSSPPPLPCLRLDDNDLCIFVLCSSNVVGASEMAILSFLS